MTEVYALIPRCGRKSYYGKANVILENGIIKLKSYQTIVCSYNRDTGHFSRLWGGYSATTMRHINSFIKEIGISGGGKKWWDSLPVER